MKIGPLELVVIFIVALLVIGPNKLPEYAKKLGMAMKEFSKASKVITDEIREDVVEPLQEATQPLKDAIEPITELNNEIKNSAKSVTDSINSIGKPAKKQEEPKEAEAAETAVVEEPVAEPIEEPVAEVVETAAEATAEEPAAEVVETTAEVPEAVVQDVPAAGEEKETEE